MRNETRNKLIGVGGLLTVGLAGLAADKFLGLEDQISQYVSHTGVLSTTAGGALTVYYGAKAVLESWLDRYRDSTPESRNPTDRVGHP